MEHQNILKLLGAGKLTLKEIEKQINISKDQLMQTMGELYRSKKIIFHPDTGYYERAM